MMRHYCTYFDRIFLPRGLALLSSLKQHEKKFTLYTLCLDDEAYHLISSLEDPQCIPIRLADLERDEPRLLTSRSNRNKIEYYFTLSPFLPLFIFKKFQNISCITYIDSDCYFFDSPDEIFNEFADSSILLIEHRFSKLRENSNIYGRFNVGLLSFRNDPNGLRCLERWADQCADWCYDRLENGKFADQKYLDEWPTIHSGVHVLRHFGVNLAPWNLDNFKIERKNKRLLVNGSPLIMYHYHGLSFINEDLFIPSRDDNDIESYHVRNLYIPYAKTLKAIVSEYGLSLAGYGRARSLSFEDVSSLKYSAKYIKVKRNPWLAGLIWWITHKRSICISEIIQTFNNQDLQACGYLLRKNLIRNPTLLLNRHILGILYKYIFHPNKKEGSY